jgi:hypothetical protein
MRIDIPEEGFYRTKLHRNGPFVAARIWRSVAKDPVTGETLDRSPVLLAELDGQSIDADVLWPSVAGRSITEAEYRFLKADKQWAEKYAPSDPVANPTQAVDLRSMPADMFRPPERK